MNIQQAQIPQIMDLMTMRVDVGCFYLHEVSKVISNIER
jgi:hypothetical protein